LSVRIAPVRAVVVGVAALGLLAGCAATQPASPGLGGSEAGAGAEDTGSGGWVGIDDPADDSTSPEEAEGLSIVPWARPHGFRITFDASKVPAGATATLTLKDFNCMEGALNGPLDLSKPKQFLVELDQGTTCWFGTRSKSWITWTLALKLPGGSTKSTTFELAFTHQGGSTETLCWGENGLACTQSGEPTRASEGNWTVEYITQVLKLT